MLVIENVRKSFGKKEVLHGVELKLDHGIYGLLGENGAGKTTLLRCMAGLYRDYQGEIYQVDATGTKRRRDYNKIGYLPQEFGGLEELKVREFLKYFADMKKIDKRSVGKEIDSALERVNLVDKKEGRVRKLSGGMQRRLGIAQTLLGKPEFILYDEPTTGLDPKERLRFQNIIEESRNADATIVISTHIVSDIECLCDRIVVMKEGNVVGIYTPAQLVREAEGKVYEITEEEYATCCKSVIQIKKLHRADTYRWRVLSEDAFFSERFFGKKVEATVEDGYLWISR